MMRPLSTVPQLGHEAKTKNIYGQLIAVPQCCDIVVQHRIMLGTAFGHGCE